jgi:hypothetical protein
MNKYKCYNCDSFCCINVKDIVRHCQLKKKCNKSENSFLYSKDEILLLSLFPENFIKRDDIQKYKNSSILYDNKDKVIECMNQINLRKEKICKLCNKEFKRKIDIKKHLLLDCFQDCLCKNEKENNIIHNNLSTNNTHSNNINNSNNTNNTNNTNNITNNNITNNNNININIELKCPNEFSNNWDTTHINFHTLNGILLSNHLLTTYLEEVLKNDNNLNVIIDFNDTEGLVYNESKYIKMKKEIITDKTIDKINNDLTKFLEDDERKEKIMKKYLDDISVRLERKITEFKNNTKGIREFVVESITRKYTDKIKESTELLNKVNESVKKDKDFGY